MRRLPESFEAFDYCRQLSKQRGEHIANKLNESKSVRSEVVFFNTPMRRAATLARPISTRVDGQGSALRRVGTVELRRGSAVEEEITTLSGEAWVFATRLSQGPL